ncbi:MAG TPA: alpha/beta hydrolase [Solirubrobacteraceae bacterium]|nr:alpha/beta hydrolase [Solirubrobacteraceae bacterium]
MRLRLWHAPDGTRVAYREAGRGPAIVLLHSCGLSHRELEPVVEHLDDRFRVVLPDLPLHGDSEDRPRHPYSPDWFADVMAGFCVDVCGPRPLVGGHGIGAEILLHAASTGRLEPERLVLMPNRLHRRATRPLARGAWRLAARTAAVPGLDRALAHAAHMAIRPSAGPWLSASANPDARDLVRHAFADVGGNAQLARSWARFARSWPSAARYDLLERYAAVAAPTLLLWADRDKLHPIEPAQQAFDLLPNADLRVLDDTGFLIAYDDPVGVARELAAFLV